MSNAVILIYCIVVTIETTFICIGNAFTIFVFWKHRVALKRASYLLLNLTVADLLVGATELIVTSTRITPNLKTPDAGKPISSTISTVFSSVSLLCLLVISLERAYAVLWPFRHRVASSRVYIILIVMVWVTGFCLAIVEWLCNAITAFLLIGSTFFICLCAILATYMTIRQRLANTNPAVEAHKRKTVEQNIKFSKTMFVVIGLSFAFWIPAITMFTIMAFCKNCVSETFMLIGTVLNFANSLVNPIVYSYRMPMFKLAIKKLFKYSAD